MSQLKISSQVAIMRHIDKQIKKHLEWAPPPSASTLPLVWRGISMNGVLILPG